MVHLKPRECAMAEPATIGTIRNLSRRAFVARATAAGLGSFAIAPNASARAVVRTDLSTLPPYGNGTISGGIRSRQVANVNGMTVHILEAGYENARQTSSLVVAWLPGAHL